MNKECMNSGSKAVQRALRLEKEKVYLNLISIISF